jgi:hypothetical protein
MWYNKNMADISVVAPKDIWEDVDGKQTLVARKGERMTLEQAMKYKVMPIGSSTFGAIETK